MAGNAASISQLKKIANKFASLGVKKVNLDGYFAFGYAEELRIQTPFYFPEGDIAFSTQDLILGLRNFEDSAVLTKTKKMYRLVQTGRHSRLSILEPDNIAHFKPPEEYQTVITKKDARAIEQCGIWTLDIHKYGNPNPIDPFQYIYATTDSLGATDGYEMYVFYGDIGFTGIFAKDYGKCFNEGWKVSVDDDFIYLTDGHTFTIRINNHRVPPLRFDQLANVKGATYLEFNKDFPNVVDRVIDAMYEGHTGLINVKLSKGSCSLEIDNYSEQIAVEWPCVDDQTKSFVVRAPLLKRLAKHSPGCLLAKNMMITQSKHSRYAINISQVRTRGGEDQGRGKVQ